MGDGWEGIWHELRDGLMRRPRCRTHPEYPCVETLGRGVVNDILSADESGVCVRSHDSEKQDFIGAERFRKWWDYLLQGHSASLRTNDSNNPDPWRSSVVGAILVASLPARIRCEEADPMTIRLIGRSREPDPVAEILRSGTAPERKGTGPVPAAAQAPRLETRAAPGPAPIDATPEWVGSRLQTVKLVLEIGVAAVALIGGIIAIIWGSK